MKKIVFIFCMLLALGIVAHYNKEDLMAWLSPQEALQNGKPEPASGSSTAGEPVAEEQAPAAAVVVETSEEVKALQFAADAGDAVAQCNLGYHLEMGDGVTQDTVRSVELYRRSAEQGNAVACFNLARCYVNGTGVEPDVSLFISWCRKAAELGNADAMYSLGMCYKQGLGVESSLREAHSWLQKAAELGHEKAAAELN